MKRLLIILAFCLGVIGCGQSEVAVPEEPIPSEQVSEELEVPTSSALEKKEKSKPKKKKIKPCAIGKRHDLTVKGKKVGWFKINQIEKVRFADFTIQQAVEHSVNYCYSFNISFSFKKSRTLEKFTFEPVFKQHGVVSGSIADVGWTGFDKEINLYDKERFKTIEVAVQPTVRGSGSIVLRFSDKDGTKYDSVKLKPKELRKAKIGPKLRGVKKEVKVKSVTGAVYSVWPQVVYFENHYYSGNSYVSDLFFDFTYRVAAWKAPKNSRTVGNISGKGKNAKLTSSFRIGLQTANSSKILYSQNKNAVRSTSVSGGSSEFYVSKPSLIRFGYWRNITTNRKVEGTTSVEPDFVRLRVEFPDEAAARTLKEKLNFNGRFLVYEMRVTNRFEE